VPLIVILSIAIQAVLIAHVIKTGRNMLWILAIFFLPPAGPIAYVAVEILPELFGGRTARRAKSGMQRMIDPNRDLRRASVEVEVSGNVDARRRLADELLERRQFDAAIEAYEGGLKGIFEHDPTLLAGLAKAQFAKGDFAGARDTLERLVQHNPEFKSPESRLLHARTLEALNDFDAAERAYEVAAPSFPGAEARLRHAMFLKRRGKAEEARGILKDLLDGAKLGPAHYRRAQAEWLDLARHELD
jgi:hypothetical protein